MTENFAKDFAAKWTASWNSHDLDTIMSHYSEDFSIETPKAAMLVPESGGRINGKENVRAYWKIGLERQPGLHFEILDVLTGIDSMTIYYMNTGNGRKSAESLFFNKDGKVVRAFVMYS